MSLAIICTDRDTTPWVKALKDCEPSLYIQVWPDIDRNEEVEFALCWKHPAGVLQEFPRLKCISSMGAGVDHLLSDPQLPETLPIVRLVDPKLAQSMYEYILTSVMYFFRDFDLYRAQQREAKWQQKSSAPMKDTTVGIMGLGSLGNYAALNLSELGFNVIGWSQTPKTVRGVDTYVGEEGRREFLSRAGILICLLPLTPLTHGILNAELFNDLPKGSALINVARGEHLVEDDLTVALREGQLRGACLDVMATEPLPSTHPFWRDDRIVITPHCSSITEPESVAPQIVENYRRMSEGKPLLNLIDVERGY